MREQCPDSAVLVDYVDRVLPQGEAEAVEKHLPGCALCTREVEILRNSLESQAPPTADAWSESRIRDRFHRFLVLQERAFRPAQRQYLVSTLAAAVLILLYPAYLGVKQMLPRMLPAEPTAQVVRLDSRMRDAGVRASLIRRDRHAQYLGLIFFVPLPQDTPARLDCRLQLDGRIVHATQNLAGFDDLGNYLLLIPQSAVAEDTDYLLTVTPSGDSSRSWQFPFTLATPAS